MRPGPIQLDAREFEKRVAGDGQLDHGQAVFRRGTGLAEFVRRGRGERGGQGHRLGGWAEGGAGPAAVAGQLIGQAGGGIKADLITDP